VISILHELWRPLLFVAILLLLQISISQQELIMAKLTVLVFDRLRGGSATGELIGKPTGVPGKASSTLRGVIAPSGFVLDRPFSNQFNYY